jgi:hypothetical protein
MLIKRGVWYEKIFVSLLVFGGDELDAGLGLSIVDC